MHHSFDMSLAKSYGVNEAIFLNHMVFWIQKNQANNKHFHEGRNWTFNSVEAYTAIFPYWSTKQMRTIINSCLDQNLIIKGNWNASGYDRTSWYALSDSMLEYHKLSICPNGQINLSNKANQFAQNGQPIPGNKTHVNNTDKIKSSCASEEARPKDDKTLFNQFIENYPRQRDIERAWKTWKKKKLDSKFEMIMNDLKKRKNDSAWTEEKYIPYPATYLNNDRWTDEITLHKEKPSKETQHEMIKRVCLGNQGVSL